MTIYAHAPMLRAELRDWTCAMGQTTAIEWCDHTFNPWIGGTKISAACDHCYAETLSRRWGHDNWGAGKERRRTSWGNWHEPMSWERRASRDGVRRRVFCASLADVFDVEVPDAWRLELMQLIHTTCHLDWLLLTKRPQVALKFFERQAMPPNVWMGTTVENQAMADLRIPILLSIPARVRFLSIEPMLGPIDLYDIPWPSERPTFPDTDDLSDGRSALHTVEGTRIDWVIAGGESGPHARPSHPDWFRSLRDQCAAAGVPFFLKQITERGKKLPFEAWPTDMRVREFPNAQG